MRLHRAWLFVTAGLWLAGCATLLEVRPLATGRADVSAYDLIGTDLDALRREAQRLCPQGGEIVRQASQAQSPEQVDGRMRAWLNGASAWIDPPQRSAQMTLVCREVTGQSQILAAKSASDAASAVPAADVAAGLPVGPLNIEW